MTRYREILDPQGTLPPVLLDTFVRHDDGNIITEAIDIRTNDRKVGKLELVSEHQAETPFAHFDGIEIFDKNYMGRGVGLASYILAIERSHARGFDFETQNFELTEHSKKIWEHLAAKSVAEVVRPFEPSNKLPGKYVGKYRVPIQRLDTK